MRYFSDRNIQKRFSQHLSVEDKPSPSCPQHSLGFSFVSGREYSGHQKAQPLLEHIYLGIVEQYVLQVSLFFPILPPVNLCGSSSEFSGIWAVLLQGFRMIQPGPVGTFLAPGDGPAQARVDLPSSQTQLQAPRWIAPLPGWLQSKYFLSFSCHPPPPVTNECLCTAQGETPFTAS